MLASSLSHTREACEGAFRRGLSDQGKSVQAANEAAMRGWLIASMLCVFMAVNFADKTAFGLAAVPIMRDLQLSHTQFGLLGASFFALFSLAAFSVGALGDRVSIKWLLAVLALVWTVAQLPLFAPLTLGAFFACRILLGAGEGPAYPSAVNEAYKWFPDSRRPLVTGVIGAGGPLGSAFAALTVSWIVATAGWHVALGALGIASALWCVAWLFVHREASQAAGDVEETLSGTVSLRAALLNRTIVGVTLLGFAAYWISALTVVWLPSFLQLNAGLTPRAAGLALAAIWLLQVAMFPLVGRLSSALTRRGVASGVARGGLATFTVMLGGLAMLGLTYPTPAWARIALATVALSAYVVAATVLPPLVGEIVPPNRRGAGLGTLIAIASLGGFLAPITFGRVVDLASGGSGYALAFLISGVLVMVLAGTAQLLMRPQEDRERLQRLSFVPPPANAGRAAAGGTR